MKRPRKPRWFIKTIGKYTNDSLIDWLQKNGDIADCYTQRITVGREQVDVLEVSSYQIIKSLGESSKIAPLKFEIFIMPPGARRAGFWTLSKYQRRRSLKKSIPLK